MYGCRLPRGFHPDSLSVLSGPPLPTDSNQTHIEQPLPRRCMAMVTSKANSRALVFQLQVVKEPQPSPDTIDKTCSVLVRNGTTNAGVNLASLPNNGDISASFFLAGSTFRFDLSRKNLSGTPTPEIVTLCWIPPGGNAFAVVTVGSTVVHVDDLLRHTKGQGPVSKCFLADAKPSGTGVSRIWSFTNCRGKLLCWMIPANPVSMKRLKWDVANEMN